MVKTSSAFIPPAAPIPPKNYISDIGRKLSSGDLARLNQKINQINRSSKNEIAILILPELNKANIDDVAHDTFNTWKVGKAGLDNGVLIVLAVKERKSRIETGKGIEGDLTDLQSNDIIKNKLNPYLKKGDFFSGLSETVFAISNTIESREGQKSTPPPTPKKDLPIGVANPSAPTTVSTSDNNGFFMLTFLFVVGLLVFVMWRLFRRVDVVADKYESWTPPTPPVPRRTYVESTYSRSRPVVSPPETHTRYVAPTSYQPSYQPSYQAPRDEEPSYVAPVIAAAVISSLFDRDDENSGYKSSRDDSPSYEVSSPEPDSDTGFGGGESCGGGSESSWDD